MTLLHTLVTSSRFAWRTAFYPISWSTLKPLVAVAVMLGVEMVVAASVARLAARIPAGDRAGLASYLVVNWWRWDWHPRTSG